MDTRPEPFEPPAPVPRTGIPSRLEIIRTVLRNPLELWGEPSYTLPWIETKFINQRTLIVNDPGLIRYILVENAANYEMSNVRRLILRPILRDGLLTAEGEVWKRSRKAMAPVFTPRHAQGFAGQMLRVCKAFVDRYAGASSEPFVTNVAVDMTELTFEILAETLFSGEIAVEKQGFAANVEELLHRMGRVDPMDLLVAPSWVPRLTRIGGRKVLDRFRGVVSETMSLRRRRTTEAPGDVPNDFLTLLLQLEGPDGLSTSEIEDNILTFIGAGHETTARALAWCFYCVANTPAYRETMEQEIDSVLASGADPVDWLGRMPHVLAAFEEALRLYPPAPSINRAAIEEDAWTSPEGERVPIRKGISVLVMPWTLHRHALYWQKPRAFMPERFLPENRDKINRFQYLPFGAGPRVCIGATFALQEAVIALAVLMHRFRFDLTDETHPWPVQRLTTQPRGGLPMKVSARVK
ncbi:cytochrome P450 [Sinorhizobium meliloti]|uniref:cytochrome P450 n=1 Tax=Rhizobium meliloti TaxID=382 RepID=UPI001297DA56|nr:cytochrome P450 [Sinorhizobium meliloti]MDW9365275.1 cytochrome P450 [Sinorhizobium meliloti]MDW9388719.1 cytochrome P450 [Sinorhizobium meliloti]MDW9502717.1 cytochrome P450 [Sinorhizobium meliloti]MDX0029287.1 cytochrome P450 [Sinorhizobium meliloti]MDX0072845.1 cytochrome P450 [Sinorhizobium meliloti]